MAEPHIEATIEPHPARVRAHEGEIEFLGTEAAPALGPDRPAGSMVFEVVSRRVADLLRQRTRRSGVHAAYSRCGRGMYIGGEDLCRFLDHYTLRVLDPLRMREAEEAEL